jgi:hypothetical protein
MSDVRPNAGTRCPICGRGGSIVAVSEEVWRCASPSCNSELPIYGEPGQRMLNCRDKPGYRRGRGATALTVLLRVAAVALAIYLMRAEGLHQRTPGVWFAVAVILIVLALVPWRNKS